MTRGFHPPGARMHTPRGTRKNQSRGFLPNAAPAINHHQLTPLPHLDRHYPLDQRLLRLRRSTPHDIAEPRGRIEYHHLPPAERTDPLGDLLHRELIPHLEGRVHGQTRYVPRFDDEQPQQEGDAEADGVRPHVLLTFGAREPLADLFGEAQVLPSPIVVVIVIVPLVETTGIGIDEVASGRIAVLGFRPRRRRRRRRRRTSSSSSDPEDASSTTSAADDATAPITPYTQARRPSRRTEGHSASPGGRRT